MDKQTVGASVTGMEDEPLRVYDFLFAGGEWVRPRSGDVIDSIDPATERVWSQVPAGNEFDVDVAVRAAHSAFAGPWRTKTSPSERGRLIYRLAELMLERADLLAMVESRDNGKPLSETRSEVLRAVDWLTYFAGAADKIRGAQVPLRHDAHAYTVREPVGVVGAILPWNSPLLLTCWKLGPALAAGNTVVIKPAELTSASTFELGRLSQEAGFPPGVINVVSGFGDVAGDALVRHPLVSKIAFTGEHTTAQRIMAGAASGLKRCSFECGGKSPYLVFSDANLDHAVPGAVHSAFRSTGQSCSLTSRLFVERPVYEEVSERIAERARRIRVGLPSDPETQVGPHSSAEQLAKTLSYIELGRQSGFRLLTGGARPSGFDRGYFVEPTVFTDVDNSSKLAQEEIFGPVLSIIPFEDEASAIGMANDTKYGLVAGVWTSDISRGHRIASALRAGLVTVNTYRAVHWSIPYGGFRLSGLGRENGLEALDEYTETKSVVVDLLEGPPRDPFGS